jgi:hypothetical protein
MQAILLYDFELRAWSGWPFLVWYVANVLMFVANMEPWIGLNDWPDHLAMAGVCVCVCVRARVRACVRVIAWAGWAGWRALALHSC